MNNWYICWFSRGFIFFCSDNTFFLNHALKFTYPIRQDKDKKNGMFSLNSAMVMDYRNSPFCGTEVGNCDIQSSQDGKTLITEVCSVSWGPEEHREVPTGWTVIAQNLGGNNRFLSSTLSQTGHGVQTASCKMDTGVLSRG
jgi:hypothetical protein